MPRANPSPEPPRRRRLSPEARRQEIIDAARPLFAQRPLAEVTIGDIAEAAGVSRPLVHAYFGGIADVFMAVIARAPAMLGEARTAMAPTPLDERLAINIPAGLDLVLANVETWYAVMGHRHSSGDQQIDAMEAAGTTFQIDRTLEIHSDLISDTPETRAALQGLIALSVEITRRFLEGELTREQTEAFLISIWRAGVKDAVPAMEQAAKPG
jgi:AcrR family transcriptional regulator